MPPSLRKVQQRKKAKAPKLMPDQRKAKAVKTDHIRTVRSVFRHMVFDRVLEISGKDISFLGQAGEFDDCMIFENLIVLIEYTTSSSSNISDHLKHKKIMFDNISENIKDFLAYLRHKFPVFDQRLDATGYHPDRLRLKIAYCSRYDFDESIKDVVNSATYLDYPVLKYFEKLPLQ